MPKPPFTPANLVRRPLHGQALDQAVLALRMRRFAEAERLAADVLKASRTDFAAVSIMAQALIAQDRGGEAILPLERALRRNGDAGLETLLGAALGGAGRRTEAIELLRKTAARRPPFPPAHQELAGQLSKDGKAEDAIAVMTGILAVLPDNVDLQLDLARLHLMRNQRVEARALLSKARAAAPGRVDILTALARALLLDGDYASAADLYRQALALQPEDAMTRADLAACLLEMGDRDAGETNLRQALRGRPQMFGRTTYALAYSSHGRFFFRQSAAAKFLQDKPG